MKKLLFLTLLLSLEAPAFAAVVFPYGSGWKFYLGRTEASTPADAWRYAGFDDTGWSNGLAPIGYGEPEIVTAVPSSSAGGYVTIYFRKSFTVGDAASISQLELTLQVDDGAVVWLNGTEIGRTNVPPGDPAYNTLAASAPSQFFPATFVLNAASTPPLASVLRSGDNLLAVHLLNGSSGSSDIFLDGTLSIVAADTTAPTIASINPAANSTVNDLTRITVTFSEPVSGVDAADLLINGVPATGVSGANAVYTFSFPQPPGGTVNVSWATNHGIQDLAIPPNPFNHLAPGHSWNYTLMDTFPPTVVSVTPPIGATLVSLTEIEVVFSEGVTGVEAADLTINGSPATNVVGDSASRYRFHFPQPPAGSVSVAWAGGHGITDLAAPPNPFAGGSWSYTLDPTAVTANLIISEFMASNTRTLADEDGEFSDWIEVHNFGPVPLDLANWSLTDEPGNLTKWTFPATNLNPGGYLVVFASNKDRRVPGRPLHTNFRLSGSGEYLALVLYGTNITSEFAPAFPPQVADVSYGLHQNASTVSLISTAATGRVLVPPDASLGLLWTDPAFADGAWRAASNGIGFEVAPGEPGQTPYGALIATDIGGDMYGVNASAYLRLPFTVADPTKITALTLRTRYDDGFVAYLNGAVVASRNAPVTATVADSALEFSGTHGQDNWFYGYYNQSADTNGIYETNDFILFPSAGGPHSTTNYWTGTIWDWYNGNPPWTELNPTGGHPNGSNNGNVHWAIRRWLCEVNGTLRITLRHAKANTGCGNGTTARIFRNGAPLFTNTVAGGDGTGLTTALLVSNVLVGDVLDFAIDPLGTDGTRTDGCDGTIFTATIEYLAPDLTYQSAATATRSNALGREFEVIELSNAAQWLAAGNNVLALHGLNAHATNADFLLQATLDATVPLPLSQGSPRYFALPTPGGPNGSGVANLGPIVSDVTHSPAEPLDHEDLFVTARIAPAFAPLASNALVYRVMFGSEVTVPMFDDGAHGDGAAGDNVFGGVIPAAASTNNEMVRWYIVATDALGRSSRWPFYTDPLKTPQYLGTVIKDPSLTNPLPVLHWFIQNPTGADSDAGARVSLYFLGQFYDNVYMNIHGQSSRGFPKKSYDLEFNPGYRFTYRLGEPPVSDINWMTTYPDKAHMRNALAYEALEAMGSPYHWVEPVRVHQNATFYGTAHLMENGDDEYVERLGRNPNNPLYKMYNTFNTSPTHATLGAQNVEKKSRKWEGSADLQALLTGVLQTGAAQRAFLYDNLDIPQILNAMAARALIGEQDCCHKNYYLYRDTLGDGEWEIWPWDVDLSYGRRWISGLTYWDDAMIIDTRMPVGDNNGLLVALYNTPEIREMYWRRQRTLMDEFLQPNGTPADQLRIERRIDEWAVRLAPDAAADLAKWGTWCCGSAGPFTQATIPVASNYQTLQAAVDLIKFNYLPQRRTYLFTNRLASAGLGGEIPNAQPADASIVFAALEASPVSGNQAEEYLVLTNANSYAVDISGWRIEGAVDFTFKPGTVIPSRRVLYVSPDLNAFRARTTGPRGGQSLFVVGGYTGRLSARGETLRLVNATGRLIDHWSYPGSPSLVQQYLRVTEIMFHPAPLAASTNSPEEFEFIELKNTGPVALNLAGVRFDTGIVFDFTGSAVTSLAPGASVLVVKNATQFAVRYPAVPGSSIAGQYTGSLDNAGERLRLVDASGEEILDFEYNNSWYPITDGFGFSLVVVDEEAPPDDWSRKSQWRPSGAPYGSPGQDNPPPPAIPPVLITEVLSRTETPPPTDTIELHNPTGTNVDIGGWFLTDDLRTPAKYRIPDGTWIPAGGYLTFNEAQFNPGGLGFAFSAAGDEAYLFSADAAGNLTGYLHGHDFGAADNGVSFGRVVTSDGREHFTAQSARTLGADNAGPAVGPVVITEIMYHPPDSLSRVRMNLPAPADNTADEFIEVCNISPNPVALFDGTNAWKLSGGVDLVLPPGVTLAPGEFALLVNFSPADSAALGAFRAKYGIGPGVQVFGPYEGKLSNASDDVEIKKPVRLGGTVLAYVLVDKVDYRDEAPWPAGADGFGYSLQRWNPAGFGNEPTNWVAAAPTAAAPTVTNAQPPRFTSQPVSRTVAAGAPAILDATVSGTGPVLYQWLFNGVALSGATNATLLIAPVGLEHDGDYTLLAYNVAGLAVSDTATLSVLVPPALTQTPTNVLVRVPPDPQAAPTTNATFYVSAFSRAPLTYQWQFNGTNISGATNSSVTFTNVTTNHLGTVGVLVSDGVTTVQAQAGLYPLVNPTILQGPVSQEVVAGRPVTLSAEYTGWPPPFTNEWRLGSAGLVTNENNGHFSRFTFTAPSLVTTQQYRFVVRNLARPGGAFSSFARIVTQADTDGDGLPDVWENAFGLNPTNAADGFLDADGDGASNWQEHVAGTNPTNALSYLRVDRFVLSPGQTVLEFLAASNRIHAVEYTEALGGNDWHLLAEFVARPTNRVVTVTDLSAATNRFYRLRTP